MKRKQYSVEQIVVDHQVVYRALSENVVKIIGPIVQSPGIGPFFEKFFDWLEDHVWQRKFFCLVDRDGHVYARTSWRQTEDDWLLVLV